jgi:hypothetical protein
MKIIANIRLLLFAVLILATQSLCAQKKGSIYAFGVAGAFIDSIVYITDVQKIDSVELAPKTNFLANRSMYSGQLKDYIEKKLNLPFRTCAIFYDLKQKNVERMFTKIKKDYLKDKSSYVKFLGTDVFTFKAVKTNPEAEVIVK